MNHARALAGTALVMLSSAALAAGPTGHVHGGARPTGAEAPAARPAPGSATENGGAAAGLVRQVALTHDTIAGRPATIAHLPAAQAPLTLEERRRLRSAGYGEVSDEKGIYFCRKVRTATEGWVNDCFQFDARELAPGSDKDGKDNDGQRRDNDGQRRDAPARKEAPAQPAGRIEYG